jgi:transcriptional regulator with XRE-family HTH domain
LVTDRRVQERVDPAMWQRPDMRAALAARDIATVFRLLQRVGVSQRRIAALTGQSQSEISEILGGRHVVSYDVLARIADGLGVPRGHLGLAYDETTAQLVGAAASQTVTGETGHDEEDSRRLLARLTELTVGGVTIDPQSWTQPFAVAWAPAPEHVGLADVRRLEAITGQLRTLDRQYGGGSCRDAVLAQVAWAQQLLRAHVAEDAVHALHVAVGDLHTLAGWTSFDMGVIGPARRHYARALEHAKFVDEPSLAAKVLYCLGRLHLHHGWGAQAVKLFQLGQVAAQESGLGRAVAMMHANLAWAHAMLGDPRQTLAGIGRARDEYGAAEQEDTPHWISFFDSAELTALRGMALATLPDPTPQQRAEAIDRFTVSTALRELPLARSRTFEHTALAWLLLANGDIDEGVRVGHQAVDLANELRSKRVIDRMAPLRAGVQQHLTHEDVRELSERINALRAP